jgi:hypothetical protein
MNPYVVNLKAMKNKTKVVPSKMEKQIEENKVKYGKRIKQLSAIIKDESYIPEGSTNGYHEFIFSMYKALIQGRKITPKMELAITNIVKSYAKRLKENNDPKLRKQKLDYIDTAMSKIHMLKRRLYECKYTSSYESNTEYFLKSIEKQVHKRGNLTIKQRKALNKMYKQFTKRIEKGTLSKKESWHSK